MAFWQKFIDMGLTELIHAGLRNAGNSWDMPEKFIRCLDYGREFSITFAARAREAEAGFKKTLGAPMVPPKSVYIIISSHTCQPDSSFL